MALPIRPPAQVRAVGADTPVNGPVRPVSAPVSALPTLPDLPDLPEVEVVKAHPVEFPKEEIPEGYDIDHVTGKKYKLLPTYPKDLRFTKDLKERKIGLSELRSLVAEDPDVSCDDMNSAAELFLPHLRVPPNKEEQEALRKARAARQKQFDKAWQEEVREHEASEEVEETTTPVEETKKKKFWSR